MHSRFHPTPFNSRLFRLLLLALCGLFLSAFSVEVPASVDQVELVNGRFYIQNSIGHIYQLNRFYTAWDFVPEPSPALTAAFVVPETLPAIRCRPTDAQHCFKVTGEFKIYESHSGGNRWETPIALPANRPLLSCMFRATHTPACLPVSKAVPRDLALLDSGHRFVVVIPLGNQGVLLRASNQEWQQMAVTNTRPTLPLIVDGKHTLSILWPEIGVSLMGLALYLSFLLRLHPAPRSTPLQISTLVVGIFFWLITLVPLGIWAAGLLRNYALTLIFVLSLASISLSQGVKVVRGFEPAVEEANGRSGQPR